jgi:hypothetical protein
MTNLHNQSTLVGIAEITERYLPVSKRLARRFVCSYLDYKFIGNRIFVERAALEKLLNDPDREKFPLNF